EYWFICFILYDYHVLQLGWENWMRYLNSVYIKRISSWGRFVGIASMLYGLIFIIVGFMETLLYSIPGMVSILLGKLLFDIGQEAKKALKSEEESIRAAQQIIKKYGVYLLCFGVLVILSILSVVAFILLLNF